MPAGRIYRAPVPKRRPLNTRQVKQVQKIIEKDKKFKTKHDYFNVTPLTTKSLTELTAITEGDNYFERHGDKIHLKKIVIHMSIAQNDTPTRMMNRLLIVRSKTGPLVVADLPAYDAEVDLDDMAILHEEIFNIQSVDNTQPIQRTIKLKFQNKRVPHMNVEYDDDDSATNAQNNPVYMYWVGSDATYGLSVIGHYYTSFFDAL